MTTEKFCTKCGKKFVATGREVICPSCKAQAAEETKRAAVLRAKKASWNGESVPVRISGRASTVIREYGKANNLPFAEALDAVLQASAFFKSTGKAWEDVEPYKSHRRDKSTATNATETENTSTTENKQDVPQDVPQDAASKPQEAPQEAPQEVKTTQAAKVASTSKTVKTVKTAGKAASKTSTSKK